MYIETKLKELRFDKATPIQEGVFKAFSQNKNIVGVAKTGTGKTHAYLLPVLGKIEKDFEQVQAVIIIPTNELVNQVYDMLMMTDDSFDVMKINALTDSVRLQQKLSKKQPQIVISTPQKLYEYVVNQNILKIQYAKYLVLDEADMMFDYDFLSMIDPLLSAMPKTKYLLFSATINEQMKPFISKYFGQYELVDTTKTDVLKIEHRLIITKYKSRLDVLTDIVNNLNPYLAFIFVSKVQDQQTVFEHLSEMGVNATYISSKLGIRQRTKVIEEVRKLKYQYVVVSDLAARGLDLKVSHVIHYDLPSHLEFFMHRSGRTGRMNDTGIVITIQDEIDVRKIERLRKQGINFITYDITKNGFEKREKKNKDAEIIRQALKQVKKPKKVKPNYKKKNKEAILKAQKKLRRKKS